jgi:hypothetical protein
VIQTFRYNALESLLLVTSMFILLAGMAFQSGVTAVGSGPHLLLTYAVAVVLIACVAVFAGMLTLEVWNSLRFARRARKTIRRAATLPDIGLRASGDSSRPDGNQHAGAGGWTHNPLKATSGAVPGPGHGSWHAAPPKTVPEPPPLPRPPPGPPSTRFPLSETVSLSMPEPDAVGGGSRSDVHARQERIARMTPVKATGSSRGTFVHHAAPELVPGSIAASPGSESRQTRLHR